MAAAVVEQVWRESAPEAVEDDLAAVWRGIAARGPVARAVMSNLIVFRLHDGSDRARDRAAQFEAQLGAVMARHPSRVIVIEQVRGACELRTPVAAGVGVCVFGPPAARYAMEKIVIRSACAEASLPSIVRRFARGDVPTSIWWTEDASEMEPLPALVSMGRQLVYDSRLWSDVGKGVRAICAVADEETDLSDLNWRRLAPVRRAVFHACSAAPSLTMSSIRIDHVPGDRALAWLLAGWLGAHAGAEAAGDRWPSINQSPENEGERLVVSIGSARVTLAMNDHRVHVTASDAPPFVVAVPRDEQPDAIAAELRTLARDAALRATMDFLATRSGL